MRFKGASHAIDAMQNQQLNFYDRLIYSGWVKGFGSSIATPTCKFLTWPIFVVILNEFLFFYIEELLNQGITLLLFFK